MKDGGLFIKSTIVLGCVIPSELAHGDEDDPSCTTLTGACVYKQIVTIVATVSSSSSGHFYTTSV